METPLTADVLRHGPPSSSGALTPFQRFAAPGSVRRSSAPSRSIHSSTASQASSQVWPAPIWRSRRLLQQRQHQHLAQRAAQHLGRQRFRHQRAVDPPRSPRGGQGRTGSRHGSAREAARPRPGLGGAVCDAGRDRGPGEGGERGGVRSAGMGLLHRKGARAWRAARRSGGGGPGGRGGSRLRPPLPGGGLLPRGRRGPPRRAGTRCGRRPGAGRTSR